MDETVPQPLPCGALRLLARAVRTIWETAEPLELIHLHHIDLSVPSLAEDLSSRIDRPLYEPVIQSLRDLAMPGVMLSGPRDEGILIGNLRPQPAPEGRARVVTRDGGTQTAQLAWLDPTM